MKLNKPKVTNTQTELENYVANLLEDSPNSTEQQVKEGKDSVTNLHDDEQRLADTANNVLSENISTISQEKISVKEKTSVSENNVVEDVKPTKESMKVKENMEVKERNKIKESLGDVIPLSNRVKKPKLVKGATIVKSVNLEEQVSKKKQPKTPPEKQTNFIKTGKSNLKDVDSQIENQSTKRTNKNLSYVNKPFIEPAEKRHQDKVKEEVEAYSKLNYKEPEQNDARLKNVEKLLAKIALAKVVVPIPKTETKISTKPATKAEVVNEIPVDTPSQAPSTGGKKTSIAESEAISLESAKPSFAHRETSPLREHLGNVFQTLVFDVNKLPLAVPLVKLGGIVNVSQLEITPLVGTPDWFMGLVPNERGNLMVVDTQKFLMPERAESEDKEYQYLIILDDSQWALACHSVGDAKNLSPDDVRWSSGSSKRPWFAGMVVEYMSALIEVDELINMLADNVVD